MKGLMFFNNYKEKIEMYYKTFIGRIECQKARDDHYDPQLVPQEHYYWHAVIDEKTCPKCLEQHEKIFSKNENPEQYKHPHYNCRCMLVEVEGVKAGLATKDGIDGADWWLKYCRKLPDYYITKEELENLGWRDGERPSKYVNEKMLTMGVYLNKNKKLPDASGRVWYEADINYTQGRRNLHRVVWSNDGLIFVTYDHYRTFYEVY